ncbi:TetR/AcrR family transcriptional regulator [Chelatococcus reniformis]|uniref:TetR family transcriptional regulator n=1 Tax=Chelatococcus reniformis TaxID=1494448 RepID=A0A916XP58_9HYPH|nr:TetR/AcrR family transcriptional regulator [Chelatococcus reniformis]GGC89195.1 TetR family transcriptional regulator [Chelatococcus reniformis]
MKAALDAKKTVREYKKKLIIEAAAKLFYEKGFQKTTLDDIASSLGVTKPFVYTYFNSKYSLLEELFDVVYSDLYQGVVGLLEAEEGSPSERLVAFTKVYLLKNIEQRSFTAILLEEEKNLSPEKIEAIRKTQKEFDNKLAALLRDGVRRGEFEVRDTAVASLAISGMVRWAHRWYSPAGRLSPEQLCDEMADLALKLAGAKCQSGVASAAPGKGGTATGRAAPRRRRAAAK